MAYQGKPNVRKRPDGTEYVSLFDHVSPRRAQCEILYCSRCNRWIIGSFRIVAEARLHFDCYRALVEAKRRDSHANHA
jgi:hypothetical protein